MKRTSPEHRRPHVSRSAELALRRSAFRRHDRPLGLSRRERKWSATWFGTGTAAIFALVSLVAVAGAQVNPFARHAPGLSKADLDMLQAAAAKLYTSPRPSVGASRQWANAKSGNSGVVRVIGVKKPCVRLRHTIKQKGRTDTGVFVVSRCNVNGTWEQRF